MRELCVFALHDDRVRPLTRDAVRAENAGRDDVFRRGDEGAIAREPLVSLPFLCAEFRSHINLVHRRVMAHPEVALRDRFRLFGKENRQLRVLEIADPIRHAKMEKIEDRYDNEPLHFA